MSAWLSVALLELFIDLLQERGILLAAVSDVHIAMENIWDLWQRQCADRGAPKQQASASPGGLHAGSGKNLRDYSL